MNHAQDISTQFFIKWNTIVRSDTDDFPIINSLINHFARYNNPLTVSKQFKRYINTLDDRTRTNIPFEVSVIINGEYDGKLPDDKINDLIRTFERDTDGNSHKFLCRLVSPYSFPSALHVINY